MSAFDALCGDRDTNPKEGHIFLDKTNPNRPIFRCTACQKHNDEPDSPYPWKLKIENGVRYIYSPTVVIGEDTYGVKGYDAYKWNVLDNASDVPSAYIYKTSGGTWGVSIGDSAPQSQYVYHFEIGFFEAIEQQEGSEEDQKYRVHQFIYGEPVISDISNPDRYSLELDPITNKAQLWRFNATGYKVGSTTLADELKATTKRLDCHVLVRLNGGVSPVLQYIPLGTLTGSAAVEGYTGTLNVPTGEQRCNQESGYYIQSAYYVWTFENGLLKSVGTEKNWTTGLQTTPLSEEL